MIVGLENIFRQVESWAWKFTVGRVALSLFYISNFMFFIYFLKIMLKIYFLQIFIQCKVKNVKFKLGQGRINWSGFLLSDYGGVGNQWESRIDQIDHALFSEFLQDQVTYK